VDCLKPRGRLLIEDCNAEGAVSDPPMFANTLSHRAHIEASLKLGADVTRGPWIGGYMKQTGLESIQNNVFVPVFGKGVNIHPWIRHTDEFDATAHYEQGLRLVLRMSAESPAPQFL
jgi:hypothetical protein